MSISDPTSPHYFPRFNWEFPNWPNFTWRHGSVQPLLDQANQIRQKFVTILSAYKEKIGWQEQFEEAMSDEIVASSKIEGVILDSRLIRSSLAQHFRPDGMEPRRDVRESHLLVKIIIDASENFRKPLTEQIFFDWHNWLFPDGKSGFETIRVGGWSLGQMAVIDKKKNIPIYVAPPPENTASEMNILLNWCNGEYSRDPYVPKIDKLDPIIQSAIAHFWFETIHPFEDGNGRIGRNLALYILNRAYDDAQPYHLLAKYISHHHNKYYEMLNRASRSTKGDITEWLCWYVGIFIEALDESLKILDKLTRKDRFWQQHGQKEIFLKEKSALNKILAENNAKFKTKEFKKFGKYSSDDTAINAINYLIALGMVQKTGGGRSTEYELILPEFAGHDSGQS